jgi:hypothetical protein
MPAEPKYTPVACSLGQSDLAERAGRWSELAGRALAQVSQTERGLRLIFGAAPGVADELQALAAAERECCAFATWSVRAADGELVLEVSGDSPEAVIAVQGMFAALNPHR